MEINMILSIPSTISSTVNVINDTQISGFANHSIFFLLSSNVDIKAFRNKTKRVSFEHKNIGFGKNLSSI
jgi:hypothetical protein